MTPISKLNIIYNRREIAKIIERIANQINRDNAGGTLLLICVLKGAFIFMADLVRHLEGKTEIEFIGLSSYRRGQDSKGKVEINRPLTCLLKGRNVLVVEDIIDTGITTDFLLKELRQMKPKTLKLCCLLDKPSRRKMKVVVDYKGFTVPDKFLVGYGLDYAEDYRHLPDICYLEDI